MSKEKYMDYIKFVDINNKKIYDIGKRSSAKILLLYLAYLINPSEFHVSPEYSTEKVVLLLSIAF